MAEILSLDTLHFIISPLSQPSECILHYIITPTSGDGTELPDIVATVVAGQQFAAVNASGFALCNDTYEFTAAAVTLRGVGRRSAVVTPQPSDGIGEPSVLESVIKITGFLTAIMDVYSHVYNDLL